MYKKLTLILVGFFFLFSSVNAQEIWSLEKCIIYAHQNNIIIQQSALNVKDNLLVERSNREARYPNLNGQVSGGYQFGRTIDPVTNDFNSLSIGTNSFSLSTGVTIFNGGRINNSIKQSQYNIKAAEADLEQTKNDIGINVATAYLNVLFAEEQLEAARKRKQLSEEQLDQVDKLIRAGARPENDRLEIVAAIARNEQAIIAQDNAVQTGMLSLKQLLQLDPGFDLRLEKPEVVIIRATDDPDALVLNDVYKKSLSNQPFIKADELKVQSALLGEDIAKAELLPSLSAFGSLSTNYSTRGQQVDGFGIAELDRLFKIPAIDPDNPILVTEIVPSAILSDSPYSTQFNENFGQSIGLTLNVPIYNNSRTRIGMERAKLNMMSTQLTANQNKQNLKTNIQQAIANARTAKRQLDAAQTTQSASKAAFGNAEKRFQLGAINTFEYATAKNNLDQAEVDLIVAKYDYLFKLKIVDFYQGKKITLK